VENKFTTKHLILFFLFIPTMLFASGKIKGVVTDSVSKESLVGANIILENTSLGAASDIEGSYSIQSIPAGRYKLKCSYIGYLSKEVNLTISENSSIVLNIALSYDTLQGKEVVITAQAIGQVAAINQQISSSKIVNVVSEQKIKELPDANAAEALGRLPGVSVTRSGGEASKIVLRGLSENMTTVSVNGVKLSSTETDSREVDLSTIAQGSLSGIVLTKAITSDMDAEAIAGNVNFVTKLAPETRTISANLQGSYNGLQDTYNQYNFYANYGERFFNNLLGVQVFGNIERRDRTSENYDADWTYKFSGGKTSDYQINNFTVQYVPEIRKRRGMKLLLDFKTPDGGVIKFNSDYNRTERRYYSLSRNYPVSSGNVSYNFDCEDILTDIRDFALTGENHLSGWNVNWGLSFTQSNSNNPYSFSGYFEEPSTTDANGNVVSGMKAIPTSLYKGPFEALIPYATNNYSLAYFDWAYPKSHNNIDFARTASVDVKRDYTFDDFSGELQFGGKYYARYHRRNSSSYWTGYYNGTAMQKYTKLADGTIVAKDFAGYGFGDLQLNNGMILMSNFMTNGTRNVYNKYALSPLLDADRLRSWYYLSLNGVSQTGSVSEYSVNNSDNGTDYNALESVGSGYIMNTLNFGTLATLITGVRIEADNDRYAAYYTPVATSNQATFYDTSSTHTESTFLPNVQLILKPYDFLNVRLAAYQGISRPDFNNRLPQYTIIGASTQNTQPTVKLGSTNLKNEVANNYEINFQLFGSKIGLFSVSAYYKEIKNQFEYINGIKIDPTSGVSDSLGIHFRNNKQPFGSYSYLLYYFYNSSHPTKVWGFEIEHQGNLRFLPGLLGNFVYAYNFSFVRTETYTPYSFQYTDTLYVAGFPTVSTHSNLAEAKTTLTNSPRFFCNAVLGYDYDRFSVRMSYFYQGRYYNGFSVSSYYNTIQKSFGRLDLSFKCDITDQISTGLNINNLNNATEGTIQRNETTGWELETSSYKYGTTADFWLRVNI
jgi:TonB-dependent receptor